MQKICLFVLVLFFTFALCAQSVSELKSKIETTSGLEKAQALLQLSNKILSTNSNEALNYAEEAKKIANNIGESNIEANANLLIAQINLADKNFNAAIESSLNASSYFKSKNKKNYAASEIILGRSYQFKKDYNKSINNFKNAYETYKESNDTKNMASTSLEIANLYDLSNDVKNSIKWYELSKKEHETLNNPKKLIQVIFNLAISYNNFGNYKKSEDLFKEALSISKENGLKSEEEKIIAKLEVVQKNTSSKSNVKTDYDHQEEDIKEKYIKDIEHQKALSLEEIEKLSSENQIIELKIKAQKDDYEKKILEERISKLKAEEIAAKEKEKKEKVELELSNEKLKTEKQAAENKQLIISVGGLAIAFILILIGFINKRKHNKTLNIKNIEISAQKDKIEIQNNNINSSIEYAKRIQEAILPSKNLLVKHFPFSFILSEPKDNVGGDFFWVHEKNNEIFIAVADCTGHGVPGAFVSIIMNNLLDLTIKDNLCNEPEDILEKVATKLTDLVETKGYDLNLFKDGMDIALVKITKDKKLLTFAGAKNSICIIRNDEIIELKSTRRVIGVILQNKVYQKFESKKMELFKNDRLFLFSDGFPDQVGGKERTKFYYPPFRNLLLKTSSISIENQKEELIKVFQDWKGNYDQIDDVTIVGLQLK